MANPVEDFVRSIEKKAAFPGAALKGLVDWKGVAAKTMGVALPIAAVSTLFAASDMTRDVINRHRGFSAAKKFDPTMMEGDPHKAKGLYNTLFNVAPTLARDPLTASSFVKRQMAYGGYVDPSSLASFASAESSMSRASSPLRQMIMKGMIDEVSPSFDPTALKRSKLLDQELLQQPHKLDILKAEQGIKEHERQNLGRRLEMEEQAHLFRGADVGSKLEGNKLKALEIQQKADSAGQQYSALKGRWEAERGIRPDNQADLEAYRRAQAVQQAAQGNEAGDRYYQTTVPSSVPHQSLADLLR